MPELNLSSLVKLPKQAGVRVKISPKPNKKASYTAYQNIDTRLGEDRYIYSEAWSMGSTKTQYDNFSVPEERRHEQYTCKAEMWLETGGVPTTYKAGKLYEQPWGTAQGFKERRTPPDGTEVRMLVRHTVLNWDQKTGKMRQAPL